MNSSEYHKLSISSRYWLQGISEAKPEYLTTLKAFNIASKYHTGMRKDGKTPEFYHQMSIFSYLRTLHSMMDHPADTLAVAFTHDTYEDYKDSENILKDKVPEIYPYIVRISKIRNGEKIPYSQYFGEMSECPVTSVVKAVDRIHNLSTMSGVFNVDKMEAYVNEVHEYFLPMIKTARRNFPSQEPLYEQLKSTLILISDAIVHQINARRDLERFQATKDAE